MKILRHLTKVLLDMYRLVSYQRGDEVEVEDSNETPSAWIKLKHLPKRYNHEI